MTQCNYSNCESEATHFDKDTGFYLCQDCLNYEEKKAEEWGAHPSNYETIKEQMISEHFSLREALLARQWNTIQDPDLNLLANIALMTAKMEAIRAIFNRPIIITSWLRLPNYNKYVGGAKNSYHIKGLAVDFRVDGLDSELVRKILETHLELLGIRLKRGPGDIHVDLGQVVNDRYFKEK